MSKKKAFSGSTMTLKDFHGGSIPSDLSLPSAPGLMVRPSDRSGFDRQIPTARGNPIGRSDHRSRPGSSGANRTFDEKTSFLSHPAHIGRNFDEDERKPLDGVSAPRRTVSDESIHVAPARLEPKIDSVSAAGKFSGRQASSSVSSYSPSAAAVNPYPTRFTVATPVGTNSQITSGNNAANSYPNAWGMRKEVVSVTEPVPSSAWSGPSAVSRFAQASALEKVSSGRWQSKHSIPDVDVIRFSEMEGDFRSKDNIAHNGIAPMSERVDYDGMQGRYVERVQIAEDGIRGVGSDLLDNESARSNIYPEAKERNPLFYLDERGRSTSYPEVKERNPPFYLDGVRPASAEGKFEGSQLQQPVSPEVSERPKLRLLPRSKPLETSEAPALEYKQGFQQHALPGHVETVNELHGNANPPKPGSAGTDGGNRVVERPKLNLKPRSQPLEQSEGTVERERKMLFGGARPRELVLKERGIDDVTINNLDLSQPSNRVKHDLPNTETKQESVVPNARYGERAENFPLDRRTGRDPERKDNQLDTEKTDMQKSSWRNENWRNSRETERQPRQQESRPEPETWRKPMEQPKPASPNSPGLRFGKSTSAVELAQAFSRSVSDAKTADHLSGQRGLPSRNQMPFSRLTDTREFYSGSTPRHQINGY